MITMMTIQKIDKDLKKPGLVWSSTGGVPISASSLGSAGADALDDGFFGAIQCQDCASDTCQDCATRASQTPKVTRKNSGSVFIKKILSQPLFRGPSALAHSLHHRLAVRAAPTQDCTSSTQRELNYGLQLVVISLYSTIRV